MKPYDPSKPLFHLHVPKTGGTSLRQAFVNWHNRPKVAGQGEVHFLSLTKSQDGPAWNVASDHYDRGAGNSIETILERHGVAPEDAQYVTYLRAPFTQLASMYYYWRKVNSQQVIQAHGQSWKLPMVAHSLEEFMQKNPVDFWQYLPQGNYPTAFDNFVFVGVIEDYAKCFTAMTRLLNLPSQPLPNLLKSTYTEAINWELSSKYQQLRPDYYEAYAHVVRTWQPVWDQYAA
jgi:hypothetical protein